MNYKLAKQLKDAGFPKKVQEYTVCKECSRPVPPISNGGYPSLEELIEACGEFMFLRVWGDGSAIAESVKEKAEGKTPLIAVARLWIELNKK